MADYYLKNADATRVYRIEYLVDNGWVTVSSAHACATGVEALLPNGNPIDFPDMDVDPAQVLVDVVLNGLTQATVEEYRAQAKNMIDGFWS